MNILSAEKINMSFSEKILLNDVTLHIEHNDKIGVIGVNGTGKSTLLKILAGVEKPLSGLITLKSGLKIAYLPQNPEFDSSKTILEQILSWNVNQDDSEIFEFEAKTILTKLGIFDFEKPVNLLSGGQKKRVAIAKALLSPVELLILDEPTNHLDLDMVTWLEEWISKYNGAIVIITHDRYFLDRVTNKIVEIEHGNLHVYKANYSRFLELSSERIEREVASDRKRHTLLKKELAWIRRGARARGTKAKGRIDAFEQLSQIDDVIQDEKLNLSSISSRLGRKIIEIDNISKSFDEKCLIKDFSLILNRDSRIGIVGKNGCGKSTLLNMISGKITPDCGQIVHGDTVKIGYFSQECEDMDLNLRVIDYIKNVAEYIETTDGKISASQMLEKFLFKSDVSWNFISKLSGGERRRLFLLRILMDSPNILLLDEPTNDLDIETLTILEDYLENFQGAIIVVSHDRYFLDRVVNRIFAPQSDGEILQYLGGYSDYLLLKTEEIIDLEPKKVLKSQKPTTNQKVKFTFNEQREFDTIDDEISLIEAKIADLDIEISKQTTDFVLLNELLAEKDKNQSTLDEKYERWEYLNDLAEKISQQ